MACSLATGTQAQQGIGELAPQAALGTGAIENGLCSTSGSGDCLLIGQSPCPAQNAGLGSECHHPQGHRGTQGSAPGTAADKRSQ